MNKKFRQIARFVLFLSLGILLLYLAFRGVDFSEMVGHFRDVHYGWIGLSLLFAILAHISRSRRWILLIEPLNHKPRLWNTINAVLFGYLANYALPRIGEVTRCVTLGKKEKIPVDALLGTVITERTIDLVSMLLIFLVLLVARFEQFGSFFSDYIFNPISAEVTALFGQALLFWLLLTAAIFILAILTYLFRKKILQLKLTKRIVEILRGVAQGLITIVRMERKWEFLLHTLFIWTNYALMTWVIVFAMPGITDHLTFVDGIFLLVIGSMGMAVPVQSGIGVFHWIVSRGLHLVYGLELTEGLVFATLQHESQTLLILLLGSLSMLFLFSGKKPARITRETEIESA